MTQRPRVLLVDDEPETLSLVRKLLRADGFEVLTAEDGTRALKMFDEHKPDLVLLDIVLPHTDGIQVLKEIRRRDELTAVIMVSALTSERLLLESMLAGADDYISKPFPIKEMRVRIRKALDKSRLRRENARLQEELNRANARLRALFERYMPAPVAERLLTSSTLPDLGGTRQIVTVLFADLRHFTPLAEQMPPDHLMELLNFYLSEATEAILAYGGTLDKFMGDGLMAFFNAPVPQRRHALRAVSAAQEIHRRVREQGPNIDGQHLQFGIGVHTGEAVVGNVGSRYLMNYTALGDTVNVANRLQEIAGGEQTLISESTYRLVAPHVEARHLGSRQLQGRAEPVDVYELLTVNVDKQELLVRPLVSVATAARVITTERMEDQPTARPPG